MKNAQDTATDLVTKIMEDRCCSLRDARSHALTLVAGVVSAPATTMRDSAPEKAVTLSARTREIMAERKVDFQQAQRLASAENRSLFMRGARKIG
jgi:hypothetical protein